MQLDEIDSLLRQINDDAFTELVNARVDSNKINQGNYNTAISRLESKLTKETTNG
jgi:hypothetical protein